MPGRHAGGRYEGYGYREWLLCGAMAVSWVLREWSETVDKDRLGFAGSSQGGGGGLLLASLMASAIGRRVIETRLAIFH